MTGKPAGDSIKDMFSALGHDLHLPKVDVDAIVAQHRKNLEALQKSASAAASGASSVFSKQQQVLEETMREISDMARDFNATGDPHEAMARQAEFARRSFEMAVRNASEVGRIVQKSGAESVEILKARIKETIDEIRQGYQKKS